MKMHGRMNRTNGIMMRTGTCWAFSSARWRRLVRISWLWIRRTRAIGMPRLSACTMALQKDLRSGKDVRSAIRRIASMRPTPSCISWRRRENSWLSGPSPFLATRLTAASNPRPASTETVKRSIASGRAFRISVSRFVPALYSSTLGSTYPKSRHQGRGQHDSVERPVLAPAR